MAEQQGVGAVGYTESINQPTKIRLADGSEVAITDWSWMTLFSTIDVLSGATDAELYAFNYVQSNPVSHSGNIGPNQQRNATLKDCNNTGKAEMPAEEEYICYALAVSILQFRYDNEASGEDAYKVDAPGLPIPRGPNIAAAQGQLVVSLEVTQKDFYQNDPTWFSAGGGAFITGQEASPRSFGINGLPSKDAIDRSPVPIHIGGTEKYKVIFSNPAGQPITWLDDAGAADPTAVLRFKTTMVGLRKRSAA
jgi:hypothetical protein